MFFGKITWGFCFIFPFILFAERWWLKHATIAYFERKIDTLLHSY
jgi:hypothetical protein